MMKKYVVFLLTLCTALTFCACGENNVGPTPAPTETTTAAPTAAPTETPTALPDITAAPTATPAPTPEPTEKPTVNLVPAASATFDTIKSVKESDWRIIGEGTLSLADDGKGGQCLRYTPDPADNQAYYSPLLNVRPYIEAEGEYEIRFLYRSSAWLGRQLIRGANEGDVNSFIKMVDTNPYFVPQYTTEELDDGWYQVSFYLEVEEDDLKNPDNHQWQYCMDAIDVTQNSYLDIDDFTIEYLD